MIGIVRPKLRTIALVCAPVAVIAVAVPTIAMATAPSPVFKGCLDSVTGTLSGVALDPSTDPPCLLGTVVSWNQAGADGVVGVAGPAGVQGPAGIQGVAGPVGVTGPTGPAGPAGGRGVNGVSGYKLVAAAPRAAARSTATYTLSCPATKVALGGGARGTTKLLLNASAPSANGRAWVVTVTNLETKPRTVHVYANCVSAP